MRNSFTLIEVIVTVIIVAILATIAFPNYIAVVERSRAAEAIPVLQALRNSQRIYYDETLPHIYTNNINDLDVGISGLKYFNNPQLTTNVNTLAFLTRDTTYQYPNLAAFAGGYTLFVGTLGRIECRDSSIICDKIGY